MSDTTLQNHYRLAAETGQVTEWLMTLPATSFQLDLTAEGLPRFLSNYMYEVSPWPVMISPHVKRQFEQIVTEFPSLVTRAMTRYYQGRTAKFVERYRMPEMVYHLLSDVIGNGSGVLARYDLMLVNQQPKLLEANVGSNIGGWQTSWLWPQLADIAKASPGGAHWSVSHTSSIEHFFESIVRSMHAHVGSKACGNVLVLIDNFYSDHGFDAEVLAIFDRVTRQSGQSAQLLFDPSMNDVSFNREGRPMFRGQIIDCVLKTAEAAPKLVTELSLAHIRRLVYFPDNTLFTMVGDKTNFALLHDAKARGLLTASEAQFVDEVIPWSQFVTDEPIERDGWRGGVREFARQNKDELVLKRGLSAQGRDVIVGRFCTQDTWESALRAAGTLGDWLVQQYCKPDRLYSPAGDRVAEHDSIWGVFGFGRAYGGAWGRLMLSDSGHGVVNCARGAKEFVVLEV